MKDHLEKYLKEEERTQDKFWPSNLSVKGKIYK